MSELYWILVFLAVFWGVLLLLDKQYDLESRGAEVGPGMLMWRTQRGIGFLDRVASVSNTGWKIFGLSGVVLGVYFMVRVFHLLATNALSFFSTLGAGGAGAAGGGGSGGVMPIIPGITTPLVAGLIAIASVVIVHELSHGVTARRAGLEVESTGVGLLAFLPLAFVEPDEEELESAPLSDKLQVFAAGSFANILLAGLCFGIILASVSPLPGLYVWGTVDNTPAENTLESGMQLTGIGFENKQIHKISGSKDLDRFLENTKPGDNVVIQTDKGDYGLVLDNRKSENEGYIGIYMVESVSRGKILTQTITGIFAFWKSPTVSAGINEYSYDYHIPGYLIVLLFWMFLFNFGVGLINLSPIGPLDGGRIFSSLFEKVSSESVARYATWGVSVVTLGLLLVNLLPWIMGLL